MGSAPDQDNAPDPPGDDYSFGTGRDPMGPPEEPCECYCLHCGRVFMSDQMWLQRIKGARDGFDGFWMCPTPNCSGAGFTIDIFPTDPDHPANEGWHFDDDEDEQVEELPWDDDEDDADEEKSEWDPDESAYKTMDELWGDEDDDLEGEEWKYGLEPGQTPEVEAPPPGVEPRTQAEQEALYDAPDRRPREIDWSERQGEETFGEDDIPF